jgi:hypothetical protein
MRENPNDEARMTNGEPLEDHAAGSSFRNPYSAIRIPNSAIKTAAANP